MSGIADIPITAGSGTSIRSYQLAAGDYDQTVRLAWATAKSTLSNIPWTVTTAGLSNVIPADASRVSLIITSGASGAVWLRFDATIPTATAYDYFLNNGDRFEVPMGLIQSAVSMAGQSAGGTVFAVGGTAA